MSNPQTAGAGTPTGLSRSRFADARQILSRAYDEFLALPTWEVLGFLLLLALSHWLDATRPAWFAGIYDALHQYVFASPSTSRVIVQAVVSGVFSIVAITFSLLLLAVQQAAAPLAFQVFGQWLRRPTNQIYFGYFVGLEMFCLILLATINDSFDPVVGTLLALILTIVGLYLLIVMIYSTVNQTRPVVIIELIHDRTLNARKRQGDFLWQTRRQTLLTLPVCRQVCSPAHGYVTRIDLQQIMHAINDVGMHRAEVVLLVSLGTFVSYGDAVAEIHAEHEDAAEHILQALTRAVDLEEQRDIEYDPAYGIAQIEAIGWTSISSAKHNPAVGLLTIHALRDVQAHWAADERRFERVHRDDESLPVVYSDDVPAELTNAFMSLAVASSESLMHEAIAEIFRTFVELYSRVASTQQRRIDDVIRRSMMLLGDHVLTPEVNDAMFHLEQALREHGAADVADEIEETRSVLESHVGRIASRGSRTRPAQESTQSGRSQGQSGGQQQQNGNGKGGGQDGHGQQRDQSGQTGQSGQPGQQGDRRASGQNNQSDVPQSQRSDDQRQDTPPATAGERSAHG